MAPDNWAGTEVTVRISVSSSRTHRNIRAQARRVQVPNMLVHSSSCLGAAVSLDGIEIKRMNSKLADQAFERDAAVRWLSSVIAHSSL